MRNESAAVKRPGYVGTTEIIAFEQQRFAGLLG